MSKVFALALLAFVLVSPIVPINGAAHGHSTGAQTDRIKALVVREARRLGVPPSLALAVAHVESHFRPRAESHKGARGVMQIMPATAMGEYGIAADQLWDPQTNVRLGLHFLQRLIDRYRGRIDLALSYYNGGSAVGVWPHARVIPATRGYVAKVRRLELAYRQELRRQGHRLSRRTVSDTQQGRGAWMPSS